MQDASRTANHTTQQFESSLMENSKKAKGDDLLELTRDLDTLTVESKKRAAAAAAKSSAAAAAARLATATSAAAKRSASAA